MEKQVHIQRNSRRWYAVSMAPHDLGAGMSLAEGELGMLGAAKDSRLQLCVHVSKWIQEHVDLKYSLHVLITGIFPDAILKVLVELIPRKRLHNGRLWIGRICDNLIIEILELGCQHILIPCLAALAVVRCPGVGGWEDLVTLIMIHELHGWDESMRRIALVRARNRNRIILTMMSCCAVVHQLGV